MKQIDVFGNEFDCENIEQQAKQNRYGGRKFRTMQEMHGTKQGYICKNCKHCICKIWNRKYYKCELWEMSNSKSTDIRLKDIACNKFENRGEIRK